MWNNFSIVRNSDLLFILVISVTISISLQTGNDKQCYEDNVLWVLRLACGHRKTVYSVL